jgi:hypothetical protein
MLKFFLFGLVLDVLITLYTKRIMGRKALQAGVLTVVITLINLYMYGQIIEGDLYLSAGIAFSLGCGLGTVLITRFVR